MERIDLNKTIYAVKHKNFIILTHDPNDEDRMANAIEVHINELHK